DPKLKQYAKNICKATIRSSDLTKKLLVFSRKGNFRSVPVNINDIINETAEMLNRSIDKKITIHQNLNANPAEVMGDPSLLQNAFLNLAINARDAMSHGGFLTFSTCNVKNKHNENQLMDEGSYLQIVVEDTGHGIPPENQDQNFEPFFTTKELGKGTGMGLAAVYGTIKQHKGIIHFDSNIDGGTKFYINLPQQVKPKTE
ncbi:MAG: ATP-binding protein, partial [Spirochaetaceae bacterium]|nr:ATP-binding protein [Spirochaetaceae bacterium]